MFLLFKFFICLGTLFLICKLHNKKHTEFKQKSFVRLAWQMKGIFLLRRENGSGHCGLAVMQFHEALSQNVMETVHTCLGFSLRQS